MSDDQISEVPLNSHSANSSCWFDGEEFPTPSIARHEPTFWQVLWAWEKLRVIYNAVLVIVYAILIFRWAMAAGVPRWESVGWVYSAYLVFVNVPFCFCHVLEIYLCFFGIRRWFARSMIFVSITFVFSGAFLALAFLN
jgi:hypothetical protein